MHNVHTCKVLEKLVIEGMSCYTYPRDYLISDTIVALIVKTGSMCESSSQLGVSHFLEHMIAYPLMNSALVKNSSHNYAYTNFYETVYLFSKSNIIVDDLGFVSDCIYAIKQIFSGDLINENLISDIRNEVINEFSTIDAKKNTVLQKLFEHDFHSVNLPIGDLHCINSFCINDITQYHKKWYTLSNSSIFVLSDIEKPRIVSLINNFLFSDTEAKTTFTLTKKVHSSSIPGIEKSTSTKSECHKICFLSKYRRTKASLENHFEAYISIVLAIDLLKYSFENCGTAYDMNLGELIVALDIFSNDWYLIQFSLTSVSRAVDVDLNSIMMSMKFSETFYETIRRDLCCSIESNAVQNQNPKTSDLFTECINNYLFDEPLLDVNAEKTLVLSCLDRISYQGVLSISHTIINNIVSIT